MDLTTPYSKSYQRFLTLLTERRLKTATVSKATGIASSTFTDWKNGKSVPKIDKIRMLALYFDVDPEYLLGETDIRNSKRRNYEETPYLHPVLVTGDKNKYKYDKEIKESMAEVIGDLNDSIIDKTTLAYADIPEEKSNNIGDIINFLTLYSNASPEARQAALQVLKLGQPKL